MASGRGAAEALVATAIRAIPPTTGDPLTRGHGLADVGLTPRPGAPHSPQRHDPHRHPAGMATPRRS